MPRQPSRSNVNPSPAVSASPTTNRLDVDVVEGWLWDAACAIRGATDAPKYKDYILPLVFYKRLSDVFDDEFAQHITEFGDEATARTVLEQDHADALKSGRKPIVRFFIPAKYRWKAIRDHRADGHLGEFVTDAMREVARLNPALQGVLDVKDYNERQSGQRIVDDERLGTLIEVLSRHGLGLNDTEPDILGRAYEYLLRKFAEGQGQSAGEFYTPKEVGWLMARLLNPGQYSTVYDPACGSGGLLIKARLHYERQHPQQQSKAPKLYGQEMNPVTYAIAKMNMFIHDYTDSFFAIGDTFKNPGFGTPGAGLQRFDFVVANPMWNQDGYEDAFYEADSWNRFSLGYPPKSSADWAWIQHMLASMSDNGRAAVILDSGAVSRGSGSKASNKEKEIRKACVESDLIESVILLPENMFYNTAAPGIVILLNKNKPRDRKEQFLLINAAAFFVKEKPKNVFTDDGISAVVSAYSTWETVEKLSYLANLKEIRDADYSLSPSQFVDIADAFTHRAIPEIIADLDSIREKRQASYSSFLQQLSNLKLHENKNHE